MYFFKALASVAGLVSLASGSAIPEPDQDLLEVRQTPTGPCATGVHVISAPGENNPPPNLGLLATLTEYVVGNITGSDYVELPYPIPQNSTDGERITTVGAKMIRHYIKRYNRNCPDTKLVLLGYSAGAVIVMNGLCGASPPYNETLPLKPQYDKIIIASVVYGDQTRQTDQPYDMGTCTTGAGRFPRGNTAGCANYEDVMVSYCDSGDGQCCTGGEDPNAHFEYAQIYDGQATEFVVGKYNDAVAGT